MHSKNFFLLLVAMLPGIALADNTVEFKGMIEDTTCRVVVNGTPDTTVIVPPVYAADLNSAVGGSSSKTRFVFEISQCPVSPQPRVYEITMSDPNAEWSGRMGVTGTATGVTFQLFAEPTGPEELFLDVIETSILIPAGATSGSKDYYVSYHTQQQNATPGTVRGSVQYTVAYP